MHESPLRQSQIKLWPSPGVEIAAEAQPGGGSFPRGAAAWFMYLTRAGAFPGVQLAVVGHLGGGSSLCGGSGGGALLGGVQLAGHPGGGPLLCGAAGGGVLPISKKSGGSAFIRRHVSSSSRRKSSKFFNASLLHPSRWSGGKRLRRKYSIRSHHTSYLSSDSCSVHSSYALRSHCSRSSSSAV